MEIPRMEPPSKEEVQKMILILDEMDEKMAGHKLGEILNDLTGLRVAEMATLQSLIIDRLRERGHNNAYLLNFSVLLGAWIGIRHITRVMKGKTS